ncbi:NAD kinase [Bacteroidota bacterium]
MKIAIYGRSFNKSFYDSIKLLFETLSNKEADIYIYYDFYCFVKENMSYEPKVSGFFRKDDNLDDSFDFLFSIGGDGTFLESIIFIRNKNIPVVGINSGTLGFLADISKSEISSALESLFNKEYSLCARTLLELKSNKNLFGVFNYALNEITLHKRDTSSMIIIHTYLDNKLMNSYRADGIIVSTPTGSTAYSMSVGGPIVTPDANNIIIAPIAPHNLSVRPLVIPDNISIKLEVEGSEINYLASLDSRSAEFDSDAEFIIRKANFTLKTIVFANKSFYSTLRSKLMWGYDSRN